MRTDVTNDRIADLASVTVAFVEKVRLEISSNQL